MTSRSLRNNFKNISLLVIYYLTKIDDVNINRFLSYSKNYTCKFDIINYSFSIFPLESGKSGNEGEKVQKFEYLENEKGFLDETKNIFHSF